MKTDFSAEHTYHMIMDNGSFSSDKHYKFTFKRYRLKTSMQCLSNFYSLEFTCTFIGYHTCHKQWIKICEICQNFKGDWTKFCEIFLNITLELPQYSLKSFFSCKKLVKTRAVCDLCLFLHTIYCKMV